MPVLAAPDPFALAADILAPPPWQSAKLTAQNKTLKPHQTPPPGDWRVWVLAGGRGAGKTEGAAAWLAREANMRPGMRALVVAPTFDDAVESCVRGPSGLLAHDPAARMTTRPGGTFVVWPNGSEAKLLGAHSPADVDRFRAAGNRTRVWWEELAASRQLGPAWDIMLPGLRGTNDVRIVASTTPRNKPKYREILGDPRTVITRGTMYDNRENLGEDIVADLERRYGGRRLGRQELLGELLDDVEGALWKWAMIDDHRVAKAPELRRIVVAIDPAITNTEDSDETGILVCGLGEDDHGYTLADRTAKRSPHGWAQRAIRAYHEFEADRIVAEVNQGGDMVEATLRTVDKNVPITMVHARKGKQLRAEPVAALYEQGRIHHVGAFPELESQMTEWTPEDGDSPDRLDALVYAISDLMLKPQGSWRPL